MFYTPANYPLSRTISCFLPISTPTSRSSALPLFTNTLSFMRFSLRQHGFLVLAVLWCPHCPAMYNLVFCGFETASCGVLLAYKLAE